MFLGDDGQHHGCQHAQQLGGGPRSVDFAHLFLPRKAWLEEWLKLGTTARSPNQAAKELLNLLIKHLFLPTGSFRERTTTCCFASGTITVDSLSSHLKPYPYINAWQNRLFPW